MRPALRKGHSRVCVGCVRGHATPAPLVCNRSALEASRRWLLKWAAAAGDAALGWQQAPS